MPTLSRQAPKLLRTIGEKRHASDDDHEQTIFKRRANGGTSPIKKPEQINIDAEPLSSDDEPHAPPLRPAQPLNPKIPASNNTLNTLRGPQRQPGRKKLESIRPPARGAYQNGQAHKTTRRLDDSKDHTPVSSAASSNEGPMKFDIEYLPRKNNKNGRSYSSKTKNIHAPPPKKFGKAPSKSTTQIYETKNKSRNGTSQADVESDGSVGLSDSELFALPEDSERQQKMKDLGLREVEKKADGTETKSDESTITSYDDEELDEQLEIKPKSPKSLKADKAARTAHLMNQLSSWKENQEPPSSQPHSSAPQEALDDINSYMSNLPQVEEEGSRCLLCSKPVEQDDYWYFWKGKEKTVKNKSAFCHAHKKKSAQKEYTQKGYPDIDWKALPRRIRRHKTTLSQILNNKQSSIHRDRYEPLALTGKAAAVPSRRTDLADDVQEQLESYALDGKAVYPGYYGSHGRRVITESVMDTLKIDIKNCKDRVAQASGIAAFVQAVMVPEAAILLIMDDCSVDRGEADKIREKTYDMGLLLHEEIEDELERQDDSDDENEYQYK